MNVDAGLTRRVYVATLLGTAATALTACGATYREKTPHTAAVTRVPAAPSDSASTGPLASTSNTTVPSKQEIVTTFGARRPEAWGLNLPGEVTQVPAGEHAVALTFDACGGPEGSGYDEKLIELLRTHDVKATLMLNQRWIVKNESIAAELAADPLFHLGNHGIAHRPLSTTGRAAYGLAGTASLEALYDEVRGAHDWLAAHQPHTAAHFRSGTAYSDDIGVDVCAAMGTPFLGFTLNADAGATFTPEQVKATLLTMKAGDVVISHMNQPTRGTARGYASVLPQLIDHGVTFHHVMA